MRKNNFGLSSYYPRAAEKPVCMLGGELIRVAALAILIVAASMLGGVR